MHSHHHEEEDIIHYYPLRDKVCAKERLEYEDFPRATLELDHHTPLIRIAKPTDAIDLEYLACSLSTPTTRENTSSEISLGETGYLLPRYARRQYTAFIEEARHFLVLHLGDKLVGFLVAYGSEDIASISERSDIIDKKIFEKLNRNGRPFIWVNQICISLEHRNKGYGKLLYRELCARILHYYDCDYDSSGKEDCRTSPPTTTITTPSKLNREVFTTIMKNPRNSLAISFHERCGFQRVHEEYYMPSPSPIVSDTDSQSINGTTDDNESGILSQCMIYKNDDLITTIENLTTEATRIELCPTYDFRAAMDPHCVGVGIFLYDVSESPHAAATTTARDHDSGDDNSDPTFFYATVKITMKWRQPGIETVYTHPYHSHRSTGSRATGIRTEDDEATEGGNCNELGIEQKVDIDLSHGRTREILRLPRYDLNTVTDNIKILNNDDNDHDCRLVKTIKSYAYIDKHDAPDTITWQQVVTGKFVRSDTEKNDDILHFSFRMWGKDAGDRCRYFRQLHYVDHRNDDTHDASINDEMIPWHQLAINKWNKIGTAVKLIECDFLAPEITVDVSEINEISEAESNTSTYVVQIRTVKKMGYYLRRMSFPLFFYTSFSLGGSYSDHWNVVVLLVMTVSFITLFQDIKSYKKSFMCMLCSLIVYIVLSSSLSCWDMVWLFMTLSYLFLDATIYSLLMLTAWLMITFGCLISGGDNDDATHNNGSHLLPLVQHYLQKRDAFSFTICFGFPTSLTVGILYIFVTRKIKMMRNCVLLENFS